MVLNSLDFLGGETISLATYVSRFCLKGPPTFLEWLEKESAQLEPWFPVLALIGSLTLPTPQAAEKCSAGSPLTAAKSDWPSRMPPFPGGIQLGQS
jgi:hypothetical protein